LVKAAGEWEWATLTVERCDWDYPVLQKTQARDISGSFDSGVAREDATPENFLSQLIST